MSEIVRGLGKSALIRRAAPLLLAAGIAAAPTFAGDGDEVHSFLGDGVRRIGDQPGQQLPTKELHELLVGPDNALVVVGRDFWGGDSDHKWTWRRVTDGAEGPECTFDFPNTGNSERLRAAAFDVFGHLVLAGTKLVGAQETAAVARFAYPDCELDDTFDDDGWRVFDFGSQVQIHDMAIDLGRIVLVGSIDNSASGNGKDALVLAITFFGDWDSNFDGNGRLAVGGPLDDIAMAVEIQRDDKIVVLTEYNYSAGDPDWKVYRFEHDGDVDDGFGVDGSYPIAFDLSGAAGNDDHPWALDVADDGRIAMAGWAESATAGSRGVVAVLTPNGFPQPGFGTGGEVVKSMNGTDEAFYDVLWEDSGKLLLAGVSKGSEETLLAAARLEDDGTFDDSFDDNGFTFPIDNVELDSEGGNHNHPAAPALLALRGGRVFVGVSMKSRILIEDDDVPTVALLDNYLVFGDGFEQGDPCDWKAGAEHCGIVFTP